MALNDVVKDELVEWLQHCKEDVRFDDELKMFSDDIEVAGGIVNGKWLSAIVDGAQHHLSSFSFDLEKEFVGIFAFDNKNFYAEAMMNLIEREKENDPSFIWFEETDLDGSICCNVSLRNEENDVSTDDPIYENIANYDCEELMNGKATEGWSAMDRLENDFPEQKEAISYVNRMGNSEQPPIYYVILMLLEANDADQIQSSLFPKPKVA